MSNAENRIHPFERANLGTAPFRCVGYEVSVWQAAPGEPVQPGSSCDYCGQGIKHVFWCIGADRRRFKVGGDCVTRVSHKGDTLLSDVEKRQRKAARDARQTQSQNDAATIDALLESHATELAAKPHPHEYRASLGETLLDALRFKASRCGAAGRKRLLREIRAAVGS